MAATDAGPGALWLPTEWDPAIESLVHTFDEARYFQGSLVIVHGPPGIGKTRLINGALAEARVSPRRVRRTFLEPRDAESPYKAIISLANWAAKLDEIAPSLDSGSLVLLPFLNSIAAGSGGPGTERIASRTDDAGGSAALEYQRLVSDLEFYKRGVEAWGERSRFLHEVGWLILDAAARRHIVWIVEAAQYLDPSSLTVIRYLGACLEENPLVMVLNVDTADNDELPAMLARSTDGPRRRSVPVPRLSRTGVAEVLGRKNPSQVFPDQVVDMVLKESNGLLLTVEQIASNPRALRSSDGLPAGDFPSPLDLVLGKLEELSPSTRDLVERLAAMGPDVSLEMAVYLSQKGEPETLRDLASLVAEGFLLEQAPGEYCFRLTALPAEIQARLPPARFRQLHREAAEALEARSSGLTARIFDLADHWRNAEEWEAAARSNLNAGRFSSDSFAPDGGLLYSQRALDAASHLDDRRSPVVVEALIEKGRALYDLGRLHESLEVLREAVGLIAAEPSALQFRARAFFYLARALSSLGRPHEAMEVVQEATAALGQVQDARVRLALHQVIGVAFMMSNQNREAVEHFRSMLSLARELDDAREVSYAQKNLSAVLLALDPRDKEGWQLVNSALEYHTRTNNFAGLAAGYLNRSVTKLELKDSEGALKDLALSRQAAKLAHAPLLIASATLQEATIRLDRPDVARAEALLKELAPWMATMEEPSACVTFRLLRARVEEARRRTEMAERLYDEASFIAEPGGESPLLWECRLRSAALARREGNLERFHRLRSTLPSLEEIVKTAPGLAVLREELESPAL